MKKLLGIVVLGLLWSNITFASFVHFNKWLYDNGHHQYLNLDEPTEGVCATEPKFSMIWYANSCDTFQGSNNLNIKIYGNYWHWIPEPNEGGEPHPSDPRPNYDTLLFELYRYLYDPLLKNWDKYLVKKSDNPYKFQSNLTEDKLIDKQLNKTGLLSYLYFQDDQILIDKISPKDRFGKFIDNKTKFRSMSVGKTMVSYVTGHAICEGYIDSVDQRIDDWDLVKNTLYDGQKLIDLLNMAAGDQKYVYDSNFLSNPSVPTHLQIADDANLAHYMTTQFQGTKKSKSKYNYNVINTNLIFNYVLFKSDDDFEKLLKDVFQKKVRIKDSVYFFRSSKSGSYLTKSFGDANAMFFATRYDYLRIGKAIIDDWQNDTCVGKYLKTIYKNRIKKNLRNRTTFRVEEATTSYGGQFHLDIIGMKKRKILGMGGYGGQQILIDVEKSKIVVVNSLHMNRKKYNYNWKRLVYNVIK